MLADARTHGLVVTVEDGIAEGGVGALLAAALGALEAETPPPATIVLGTPAAYPPQGKPAALLANLGLDGPGIAATVVKLLDAARAPSAPEVGHAVERGLPVVVELERLPEREQPGGAEIGPHEHLHAVVGERGAIMVVVAEDGRRRPSARRSSGPVRRGRGTS